MSVQAKGLELVRAKGLVLVQALGVGSGEGAGVGSGEGAGVGSGVGEGKSDSHAVIPRTIPAIKRPNANSFQLLHKLIVHLLLWNTLVDLQDRCKKWGVFVAALQQFLARIIESLS